MPFVRVRHKPEMREPDLKRVVRVLPMIVAEALHCEDPDGGLTAQDIEVAVEEFGPRDISGDYDLQIMVEANEYPSRKANLKKRTQQIVDSVRRLAWGAHTKFYVWVRLSPAAFVEGQAH